MAHKKGQSSSVNGRDSQGQRRGVKLFAGQTAKAGSIIVRQVGEKFKAGKNTSLGKDFTIFALKEGIVKFTHSSDKVTVNVIPA
ncbi:MAG: 50S ribosomal protein L27 [Deltaproteobacteria bacterium]|nr:50S ribosomal protein L27 [Deltaproteobacteria bacterium]